MHIYAAISDPPFMLTKDQEGCNDPINPLSPHHGACSIVAQEALRCTMKETDAPHLWRIFCKLSISIHPQPFRLIVCFSFAISVCSNSYRGVKKFYAFSRQCVFAEHLRNSCLFQIHREHFLSPRVASTNFKEMFMMQIQMMFPNALYFQINPNK